MHIVTGLDLWNLRTVWCLRMPGTFWWLCCTLTKQHGVHGGKPLLYTPGNAITETLIFKISLDASGLTEKLTKPWTTEIFMECYCVARNNPIRHEITKPQTAKVISLWFWGLLVYPELYCDWPVHNQHSWNFSGVHGFLSFTVNTWRDGCLKSNMANWGRPINQRKKSGTHENFDLVSNVKLLCAKPTA